MLETHKSKKSSNYRSLKKINRFISVINKKEGASCITTHLHVFKKDNVPKEEAEILLTSEEAADLLKISTRTLQRMRKDKTIPYMMVRSKCRYRLTDLEECVRRKIVHCNPKTLEEFKHNYLMTRKEADDGRDW